jgi:inorganic triphosphatase YgiF
MTRIGDLPISASLVRPRLPDVPKLSSLRNTGVDQRELDLRIELTPEQLHQLDQHPALSEITVEQPNTKTLRSIYFDTPDQRLCKAGISLLVHTEGDGWVQTIRCGSNARNGVSNPVEIELAVDTPEPHLGAVANDKLQHRLTRLMAGSCLEPTFETEIKRTSRRLHTAEADLELTLDEGVVRAGASDKDLCEAELELKAGPPVALLEAATKLFADASVHFAKQTMAERGYDLAMGRSSTAPRPVQGKLIPLDGSGNSRQALAAIVSSVASQIDDNRRVVLETEEPEGAHQLRIGIRRLRSALRAFRPLIDIPALQEMDKHAKSLARVVGELRDADVFIADIYAPVAGQASDHRGLRALKDALQRHRAAKRDAVCTALEGVNWSRLQLHLVLFPQTIEACTGLDDSVEGFSRKALDQAWKKTAKKGKRLDSLSSEERHKMRRLLKKLRYTAEFFAPLYPGREVNPFVKRLKQLQNVFGYVNDVVTARQIEDIASTYCRDDGDAQYAAGYVLGWHSSRAPLRWEKAQDDWRALKKAARFWR